MTTRHFGDSNYYSTQHDLDQPIITFTPPKTWYPQNSGRLRGLYFFYFIAFALNIAFLVYKWLRYKTEATFTDKTGLKIEYGWFTVYFSHWVVAIQIIFFFFCMIDLNRRYATVSASLHAHKDRFYDVLFALTLFVSCTYFITILPTRLDQLNITLRMFAEDLAGNILPSLLMVIETLVVAHRYATHTSHFIRDMCIPLFIYGLYIGWSYICHSHNHQWPYQFQNDHSKTEVILTFLAGAAIIACIFALGRIIARCFWSDEPLSAERDDDIYGSYANFSAFESFINDPTKAGYHYNQGTESQQRQNRHSFYSHEHANQRR